MNDEEFYRRVDAGYIRAMQWLEEDKYNLSFLSAMGIPMIVGIIVLFAVMALIIGALWSFGAR